MPWSYGWASGIRQPLISCSLGLVYLACTVLMPVFLFHLLAFFTRLDYFMHQTWYHDPLVTWCPLSKCRYSFGFWLHVQPFFVVSGQRKSGWSLEVWLSHLTVWTACMCVMYSSYPQSSGWGLVSIRDKCVNPPFPRPNLFPLLW